jgi:hypothetical protein
MFTQRLSSLEFYTYAAFFAVVVGSISAILPGRKAPVRTEPYSDDELKAHDRRLPKYFLTGGAFLLLGGVPGGVAVDEHVSVSLRSHEHIEALTAGVLLDVTL